MNLTGMKKYPLLCIVMLLCFHSFTQQSPDIHTFSLSDEEFLLDGKPFQIIGAEMHPSRIPAEYWRHRIQMAKAMGCNTIATYIFWNAHEAKPGVFDFKTGNHDVAAFLKICQEEGMWVILRPGPYVCAEYDFGGLPPYLLKIPDIKIRCMDPRYIEPMSVYITKLAEEVKTLQCSNGGPILMVQIENEYGSYGNDKEYLHTLKQLWMDNGINVPFYTADGATPYMLEAGTVEGAAIGLDSGSSQVDFDEAEKHNPDVPSFSSETYPGWLTHWKEEWAKPDTTALKEEVTFLLKTKKSFSLYVFHGGTNFGFTAGANAFSPTQYQPDITSYDYDAPLNEQGQPTPKYYMLRNLIRQYVSYDIPEPPAVIPTMTIPPIQLKPMVSLFQLLNDQQPIISPQPIPFEAFDQNQGFAAYKTTLIGHKSGILKIWEPHDYAVIYLNGKFIDTVCRDGGKWEVTLPKSDVENPELLILMEGMGHINFAQFMIDRKGITDRVTLNGMTLMNWEIYPLPMDESFIQQVNRELVYLNPDRHPGILFNGNFKLKTTADTYFDMSAYSKGVVYVNGHNLGRFWNVGPQQRLYCPASWLKKGENEIIVLDLLQQEAKPVSGCKNPW